MVRTGLDFFGNMDDAEDVAQDALVRLWGYCEQLDARRNLEALAVMVAKNICVEHYRRRKMSVHISSDPPAHSSDDADAPLMAQDTSRRVDAALDGLSPRERELVRLRHMEDKTPDEIAQETGIPKPSIRSMLSTAKNKLRKRLRQ